MLAGALVAVLGILQSLLEVDWVLPTDAGTIAGGNTGIKRILVTVRRDAVKVAELHALRTDAGGSE